MRSLKVLSVFTVFLILLPLSKTFGQASLSDRAFVSLLTCGPGDELYSVFGHTAIRISDPGNGIDTVYNYGTFDFEAPGFYLNFVKGNLKYFVSTSTYPDFIYTYQYYDRDVYEQVLNLTPQQEQKIYNELNDVLASERRFYTYKFVGRNCTTMAADVIELGMGSQISDRNKDSGKTYRQIIYNYLDNHFIENLGISLMFGAKTDTELGEPFLPIQLMEGVENTNTADKPLSKPVITVNKSREISGGFSLLNNYYTFALIVLVLILFSGKKSVYVPYFVFSALMGIFFCMVGLYSFHEEITLNYNALLFNPLLLILVFFIYTKNKVWIIRLVYTCLIVLATYIAIMINKPHLILVLPLIVLTATMLIRLLLRQQQI